MCATFARQRSLVCTRECFFAPDFFAESLISRANQLLGVIAHPARHTAQLLSTAVERVGTQKDSRDRIPVMALAALM